MPQNSFENWNRVFHQEPYHQLEMPMEIMAFTMPVSCLRRSTTQMVRRANHPRDLRFNLLCDGIA